MMNRLRLNFARLLCATVGLSLAASAGCDRVQELSELPSLPNISSLPTLGSDRPHKALVVIPSAPPRQVFTVTVTDERYLADIARRLGTTVEILIRDNDLADSTIHRGDQLQVRTTARQLAEFKRLQLVRAERRRQRAEARRIKAAAAKAAKQAPKRRRVRKRRRHRRRRHKRRAARRHKRSAHHKR